MKRKWWIGAVIIVLGVCGWWRVPHFIGGQEVVPKRPQTSAASLRTVAAEKPLPAPRPIIVTVRLPTAQTGETAHILEVKHELAIAQMRAVYDTFIKLIGLNEADAARFLDLVTEERQSALDAITTARDRGLGFHDDPALEQITLEAATVTDPELERLLGAEGFAKFQAYRDGTMARMTVDDLRERLADGAVPLTDTQYQQLTQTLGALEKPENIRRAPIKAVVQTVGMPVTDDVMQAARGILQPAQLPALVAVRESQHAPKHEIVGAPAPGHP